MEKEPIKVHNSIYDTFQKHIIFAYVIGWVIILIMEICSIVFEDKLIDTVPNTRDIIRYIIYPSGTDAILISVTFLALCDKKINEKLSNYVIISCLSGITFVLSTAHNCCLVSYAIFMIPILTSPIFANLKLTIYTIILNFFLMITAFFISFYFSTEADHTMEFMNMTIAVIMLFISVIIVLLCVFLNKDREVQIINSKQDMQEKYEALCSMAKIYQALGLINMDDESFEAITMDKNVRSFVKTDLPFSRSITYCMKSMCTPEYLDELLKFLDLQTLNERLKGKQMISMEFIGKFSGWVEASYIPISYDENHNLERVAFATKVIDREKRREAELIHISNTDTLTGLYNYHAYKEECTKLREKKLPEGLVLFSLDVNGLKNTNDTYGHQIGDVLLKNAAMAISEGFSEYGKCFRMGGDEFSVIAYDLKIAPDKVIDHFNEIVQNWECKELPFLSISAGFADSDTHPNCTIDEIEVLADKNMYFNKNTYYLNIAKQS